MSDGNLTLGTAILLRSFKDHPNDKTVLTFPAPKEKDHYHLAIWLGIWENGAASVSERLNAMGWYYNPEKVAAAKPSGGDV